MPLDENRRLVRFDHNCSPYTAGDKAAFPIGQAQKLVARGIASYIDPEAVEREARENFEREMKRKQETDDVDDDDETDQSDDDDESDAGEAEEGAEDGASEDDKSKGARKGKAGKRRRVRA